MDIEIIISEITTLQGIKLTLKRSKSELGIGPAEYFVNDKPVVMWEYKRSDDEFYIEEIIIKDFAQEINLQTGKVS